MKKLKKPKVSKSTKRTQKDIEAFNKGKSLYKFHFL